ncbi:hypothetical protein [Streptomyces sp. NPDC056061]|uniref:hypothetical protein n=1 Tax=Streptomyces sp. NPDC056061 TaxID=3345700 RepID=UPI0035DF88F2
MPGSGTARAAVDAERDFADSRVAYRDARSFLVQATTSGDNEAEMFMKSMAGFGN